MTVKIGSNIESMRIQAQLRRLGDAQASTQERLASGQRINHASDDAAGLAISTALNAKSRVFAQGIRNLQDGISMLSIVEGAVSGLSEIVTRIQELAQQASNGSYSIRQRSALDREAQALSDEFTRIIQSTSFNGIGLLNGGIESGVRFQGGFGIEGSLNIRLGSSIGTGSLVVGQTYSSGQTDATDVKVADLNGDGLDDIVTLGTTGAGLTYVARLGRSDGSFATSATGQLAGSSSFLSKGLMLADVDNDGALDIVGSAMGGSATMSVARGNGDGTFKSALTSQVGSSDFLYQLIGLDLADINNDGDIDAAFSFQATDGTTRNGVALGRGDGTFDPATTYTIAPNNESDVRFFDLNEDGNMDLLSSSAHGYFHIRYGDGTGAFSAATSIGTNGVGGFNLVLGDVNGDGRTDVVLGGNDTSTFAPSVAVAIAQADGTFAPASKYVTGVSSNNGPYGVQLGDLNGDGQLDIVTSGPAANNNIHTSVLFNRGDGSFGAAITYEAATGVGSIGRGRVALGDFNGDSVLEVATVGTLGGVGVLAVLSNITKDGISPMQEFSLKSVSDSRQALDQMQRQLDRLNQIKGIIGSHQSRTHSFVRSLQSAREESIAASSTITDVDVAFESANLVRQQITQRIAQAVLSQANLNPQIALQLLKR